MEETLSAADRAKKAAGEKVAAMVEPGMRLGLGTGSTAAWAIRALGRRVREEGLRVVGVPTSYAAEQLARAEGIPLVTLADVEALDLAFDGADEVSPELNLIKGRGAAHTREKVVASLARRFVVLVDASKLVDRLGTRWPVPIEVLPMAAEPVLRQLRRMGAEPVLRMGKCKDGPVVTDQGFWVIDARFPDGIDDPHALAVTLSTMPGVLDHGLFLGLATDVLVGQADGQVRHIRRP
ncbi:ribose-5-phosphate isomerase RpiA [Rhodothermus marinus]|uniref:ribose-5-phosphate isomerase RpiA n=1 Tax=Rhodothermus marinus TaxID=29549 RepID=UPI0012BA4668|nr:ribose-5-phosphate isomerase RpiA [Rhodothermus marinus]BBM68637.1 ribose-5-phosphate isomerase A [Rhodothermus marinus]BBM71602.1 ribose-5-phosphate isomerase A [Rhodothermus marinus]